MREYQFRIVQEALYQNTLVSLPTGLGKTFIAAVVMYNFYRWYPTGKVIFMAPTRPLVKQQIDACYDIMAIPQNVTAELTGTKVQTSREELWKTKRVFFITPQVLQNDIVTFPDFAKQIKCLVFDEAHKARGNHAYCEVIRKLLNHSRYFRVLALSATPGNSTNDIIDLSINLLISHLEARTEDSPDVAPYVFHRAMETVVVPLGGKLEEMRAKYLRVLEKYVKVLKDHRIITGNCANLTKGKIFMTLKDFNLRSQHHRHPNHGDIVRTLNICITFYHGYELLIRHGMRGFLNFFEEHSDKALLRGNAELFALMEEIQQHIGPRPDIALLPDGTIPEIAGNSKFGHPKFYKLRNIVLEYFSGNENKTSKVIVFSEFKETVMEAYAMLMQHTPVVRPKYFMGQGAITQKQQIGIIKSFKDGECNTLISTCIGEEGLDIGEVDLIICFDISNKSPIRLVQRMGRTGRKKQGKVIILVTQGKEQELLRDSLASKNYLSSHILNSHEVPKNLYKDNPRMIPENIFPTCQKMHISVPKIIPKGKTGNIKDMFNKLAKGESSISQILNDIEIVESQEYIASPVLLWNQNEPLSESSEDVPVKNYSRCLDSLRIYQPTGKIGHSADTAILVSLLQFSDSKRYNLPITQQSVPPSQGANKKRKMTRSESGDNFKQTDIRNMFGRPKSALVEVSPDPLVLQTSSQENLTKKKVDMLTNDLLSEISSFMIICDTECRTCNFCAKTSLCNRLRKLDSLDLDISNWTQPDIAMIENLTEVDFDKLHQNLTKKEPDEVLDDMDIDALNAIMDVEDESFRLNETPKKNSNMFSFEVPQSIKKVTGCSELSINVDVFEETFQDEICEKNGSIENSNTFEVKEAECVNQSSNVDLFEDEPCSSKDSQKKIVENNNSKVKETNSPSQVVSNTKSFDDLLVKYRKTFQFFKLSHLDDFCGKKDTESPDVFKESPIISTKIFDVEDPSPILCSIDKGFVNKKKIEWNAEVKRKNSQQIRINDTEYKKQFDEINSRSNLKSKLQSVTKSTFYAGKDTSKFNKQTVDNESKKDKSYSNDICELSLFGVVNENVTAEKDTLKIENVSNENNSGCSEDLFASPPNTSDKPNMNLNIADVCDISLFGLAEEICNINNKSQSNKSTNDKTIEKECSVGSNLSIADVCDISMFGLSGELIKNKSSSETIVNTQAVLSGKKTSTTPINKVSKTHYSVDLTIDESPIIKNYTTPKETDSDSSQSPVLGYSKPSSIQRNSCKKSLFTKEVKTKKLSQLSLEDLCDSSILSLAVTPPDKTDETERLSPVLSQRFRKPSSIKTKLQAQRSGVVKKQDASSSTHSDESTVTISQVIDMINKPTGKQNIKSQKTSRSSLLCLSDDDNVFENPSIRKTPMKKSIASKKPGSIKKTPKPKQKCSTSKVITTNSDDEFEESPLKPKASALTRKRLSLNKTSPPRKRMSVDDRSPTVTRIRKKRKKKTKNPYIEDEAVLSSDEYATEDSSSEGGASQDVFETSFVTSVDVANTTTMHAKYLQSVRSPLRRVGGFKIPDRPTKNIVDVLSQKENYDDNTYLNDSFCVDVDESQITCVNDLSELEIAEQRLEKYRKQKLKTNNVVNYKKRRRIVVVSSDSDE